MKKGFDINVAKLDLEKRSAIPNYVFQTKNPIQVQYHQFREIKKDKWFTKKEFVYRNSHDLVL